MQTGMPAQRHSHGILPAEATPFVFVVLLSCTLLLLFILALGSIYILVLVYVLFYVLFGGVSFWRI